MTRELAIMELKRFSGTTQLKLSANFWTALNMAIKTLEQQPCEDTVSRQAVLEKINDWWGITSTSGEPTLCDYIRDLPSVTPTRKKGKWIEEPNCWLRCSCCNSHHPHTSIYAIRGSKYCPECGAEMERE